MTQTERLMMSSRPKQPKYARNKNILVIGGSGSGKTRFFVKPNLMQMHSSYVVTDPNGYTNDIFATAGIAQKNNCALTRLDYMQEAGFTPALNAHTALRGAPISMGRGETPVRLLLTAVRLKPIIPLTF